MAGGIGCPLGRPLQVGWAPELLGDRFLEARSSLLVRDLVVQPLLIGQADRWAPEGGESREVANGLVFVHALSDPERSLPMLSRVLTLTSAWRSRSQA